jgi:hypothetical protein
MALCNLKVAPVLGSKGDVYDELKLFLGDYETFQLVSWINDTRVIGPDISENITRIRYNLSDIMHRYNLFKHM